MSQLDPLPSYPSKWKTTSRKEVYDNPWITLEHHETIHPGGEQGIYGYVHFKHLAIGIIPLDKDLNTWIVGQYRYPLGKYSWEIPEGGGKLDIDPLESAKRELKEETGIIARKWTPLLEMDLSNSVSDERGMVFLAEDLELGAASPDDDEDLQIMKIPFEELYQRTIRGEIRDSLAVASILRLKLELISKNEKTRY